MGGDVRTASAERTRSSKRQLDYSIPYCSLSLTSNDLGIESLASVASCWSDGNIRQARTASPALDKPTNHWLSRVNESVATSPASLIDLSSPTFSQSEVLQSLTVPSREPVAAIDLSGENVRLLTGAA